MSSRAEPSPEMQGEIDRLREALAVRDAEIARLRANVADAGRASDAAQADADKVAERHDDAMAAEISRSARLSSDITDLEGMRDALRRSEEQFHAIADSVDQMIWSTRPDGFHDYYNQRWYEYTGVPVGSTDGVEWNGMFHPDDRDRAWETWRRSLDSGEPYHIEYRLRHRSGDFRWVLGRAKAVRDDAGAIKRWYGTCTDIHELKTAQEAERRNAELLRTLSELDEALRASADAPTAMYEAAGVLARQLQTSRCAYAAVDADNDSFTIYRDYLAPGMASSAGSYSLNLFGARAAADMRSGRTLVIRDVAGELATGDGRETFEAIGIEAIVCCPLVKDGSLVAMMAVHQDRPRDWQDDEIALVETAVERCWAHVERVGAETRLRESEEFNRRILTSSNDCIKVLSLEGMLESMSPGGQVVMEIDDFSAIVGADWASLWPETERHKVVEAVAAARGGDIGRFQGFCPTGRGTVKYWDVIVSPIEGADGSPEKLLSISRDISALHAMQQSLEASEQRYRALFEAIDEGFCIIEFLDGPEGPLSDYLHVEANPAYLANAGIEDIVGKRLREVVSASEADAWAAIYGRVLLTGEPVRFERELVETGRHLDLAAFRVEPPQRRQVAVLFQDITQRRRVAKALSETEERYRLAARATNDAIWDWDLATNHVRWNEALYANHGHAKAAVEETGDWWIAHIHPDDRERVSRSIHEVIDGAGQTWTDQYRFERGDGTFASVLDRGTVVRDENGRAVRMIGAMLDVTKLREAEAAIRVSEDRLRLAADATQIGIFDYDLINGSLDWDDRVRASFGLSPGAPVDYDVFLRGLHPDDREATDRQVQAALDPAGSGGYDIEYRTCGIEDGKERWIAARGRAQFEGGKAVRFIGTTLDITERKEATFALSRSEAELRVLNETLEQRVADEVERRNQAEDALRQAQKMETLGQLTGGVAHDFNNLLQIVSGNIDLIQRGLPQESAKLRRAADNAARGAERAAVLTQRLLAFSRRQPLAPKPIDPNKLVGGMSELLHRTLGETIEVETVLSSGLWPVEADPNQLENAILNLAVNARDAMAGGGKLTIETCNTHLDRAYVMNNAEVAPGQYVCICVTDSGVGMDEDTVTRAFEPFFTTKEVGKGTGLGLSMVYGFVKQSGGHLKIYSEPGVGTTVKIYLRRLIGAAPEAENAHEELIPEGGHDETILVCEDDDDVRAYTVEVLRELGYRVLEAGDGPAALRMIERREERIDLLFTDVVLPRGMTGAVLAERARTLRPDLRILFTTGYARNAIVHHGRLDPGVELITKPFSYADLAARVRDMLDGQA